MSVHPTKRRDGRMHLRKLHLGRELRPGTRELGCLIQSRGSRLGGQALNGRQRVENAPQPGRRTRS